MSKNEDAGTDWPIELIRISIGVVIFLALSSFLTAWELQREDILGTENPGVLMYLLMPVFVSFLVVGAIFVIQGGFSLAGMWLAGARAQNTE